MKYLLMCCHEEEKLAALPKTECDALMEETSAYCEALHKSGHLITAEKLEPVDMATTVRVRNGNLSMTDGPFAETKEQLGGFALLDVEDFDEAMRWADKVPVAPDTTIEVRQIMDLSRFGYESSTVSPAKARASA